MAVRNKERASHRSDDNNNATEKELSTWCGKESRRTCDCQAEPQTGQYIVQIPEQSEMKLIHPSW